MEQCDKCKQLVENCECHIPDEEKHAGLYHLVKSTVESAIWFVLLPYSESKHLPKSEDAPLIRHGIVYGTYEQERKRYNLSRFENAVKLLPEVKQLCIESTCKACEGTGDIDKGLGLVYACRDCDDQGKTYKLYEGSRCPICAGTGEIDLTKLYNEGISPVPSYPCDGGCNGTGKVDETEKIVAELMKQNAPK